MKNVFTILVLLIVQVGLVSASESSNQASIKQSDTSEFTQLLLQTPLHGVFALDIANSGTEQKMETIQMFGAGHASRDFAVRLAERYVDLEGQRAEVMAWVEQEFSALCEELNCDSGLKTPEYTEIILRRNLLTSGIQAELKTWDSKIYLADHNAEPMHHTRVLFLGKEENPDDLRIDHVELIKTRY